jgi:dihydroorotate dehydrogenase electron transfer subunit
LLGRGVGLATLAPLAALAAAAGTRVTAILSVRAPEFLMSEDYFRAQGATVLSVTDADGSSQIAALEKSLCAIHADTPFDYVATCGSNRLMLLLQKLTAAWGIPGEIAVEQHMGCAMGMCFACVRTFCTSDGAEDYRRVCWDGPVFKLAETLPWSI